MIRGYSPAVKREAFVSALQDLTRVHPALRYYKTPPLALEPKPWYSSDGRPYDGHSGTDLKGKLGDPIYSLYNGKVWIAPDGNGWHYIHITTASGYVDRYYHCDKLLVKTGDTVWAGQQIGTMGAKGKATGVHLHVNSTGPSGEILDSFARVFGYVTEDNKIIDPIGSTRTDDGMLQLVNTDPFETTVTSKPVKYRVNTGGLSLRVRERPGTNFDTTGRSLADGTEFEIDKWANYDHTFSGDNLQSWGRLKNEPWNWVALRYGKWNVERV